jgi:hypothetical protein
VTASTSETSKRKPWWLLAVAILAVGGLVAAAMAMTTDDDGSNSRGPSSGSIGDPEVRQAKWKLTVKRAAPGQKLSKRQKASLLSQRENLKTMTQDIFDALFLSPEKLNKALRTNFTVKARKSFQRLGVGAPKGAEDVRIRRRSAWIVIDETARATMKVYVLARGQSHESPFATSNRSVLYVAREKGDWKVFGYEVDQQPFKKKKATNKDDKAKEKQGTSSKDKKQDKKKNKKKNKKKRSGGRNQRGDRS